MIASHAERVRIPYFAPDKGMSWSRSIIGKNARLRIVSSGFESCRDYDMESVRHGRGHRFEAG